MPNWSYSQGKIYEVNSEKQKGKADFNALIEGLCQQPGKERLPYWAQKKNFILNGGM